MKASTAPVYRLWDLRSDDIAGGLNAVSRGRADGFYVSKDRGFLEKDLAFLEDIPGLRALSLGIAYDVDLKYLERAKNLESLFIWQNDRPCDFSGLTKLRDLGFPVSKKRSLPAIGMPKLEHLAMWSFDGNDLSVLRKYRLLKSLTLIQARKLMSLAGIEYCKKLVELIVAYCPVLEDIRALGHRTLKILDFQSVKRIATYEPIRKCTSLTRLIIDKASPLRSIDFVLELCRLQHLVIRGAPILDRNLAPLMTLPALSHVYLDNKREYEPALGELKRLVQLRKQEAGK